MILFRKKFQKELRDSLQGAKSPARMTSSLALLMGSSTIKLARSWAGSDLRSQHSRSSGKSIAQLSLRTS